MAKSILAWNEEANQFYREIGKKTNRRPYRFYLGDDQKKALANAARLEALWAAVEERWQQWNGENRTDDPFPCWDEVTLTLGRAIGKGEWTVKVEPPECDPQAIAVWLASLRTYFPMIRAEVEDTQAVEKGCQPFIEIGKREAKEEEERHQKTMRNIKNFSKPFGGMVVTKETLHNALDAYKGWIESSFVDIEGRTTQTGKKRA
jgi:hypothetical protein